MSERPKSSHLTPEMKQEVKRVFRKHKITRQCLKCENDVPFTSVLCEACKNVVADDAKEDFIGPLARHQS